MSAKEFILKNRKGVNHNTMFSLWRVEHLMEAYAKHYHRHRVDEVVKELEAKRDEQYHDPPKYNEGWDAAFANAIDILREIVNKN